MYKTKPMCFVLEMAYAPRTFNDAISEKIDGIMKKYNATKSLTKETGAVGIGGCLSSEFFTDTKSYTIGMDKLISNLDSTIAEVVTQERRQVYFHYENSLLFGTFNEQEKFKMVVELTLWCN